MKMTFSACVHRARFACSRVRVSSLALHVRRIRRCHRHRHRRHGVNRKWNVGMDFDYSTLSATEVEAPKMARPLPCWCRDRELVPLEENPLLQWVKRRREVEPDYAVSREVSCGLGRGRPLPANALPYSSDFSSNDNTEYVGAYWRNQRRLVEPGLEPPEPVESVGPSVVYEQLSGRQPTHAGNSGSLPPSRPERRIPSDAAQERSPAMAFASSQSPSDSRARRGTSHSWKARHEEVRRRTAGPWRSPMAAQAHYSPPVSGFRGQPRTARSQPRQPPSHGGDGANRGPSGRPFGGGGRNRGRGPSRRAGKGPMRPRRVPSFDPADYTHPFDLSTWRNSWGLGEHGDSSSDEELSDEEDSEYDEPSSPGQDSSPSLPSTSSMLAACSLTEDPPASSAVQPNAPLSPPPASSAVQPTAPLTPPPASSAVHPTAPLSPPPALSAVQPTAPLPPPPDRTAGELAFSRFLEVRGLLYSATTESIYDTISSFTAVDDVELFYAEDGVGARITATRGCSWRRLTCCSARWAPHNQGKRLSLSLSWVMENSAWASLASSLGSVIVWKRLSHLKLSRSRRCLRGQSPRVKHPLPLQWAGAQLKCPSLGPRICCAQQHCLCCFFFFFCNQVLLAAPDGLCHLFLKTCSVCCVCVLIKTATCNSVLSESFTVKIAPKPSLSARHCLETISSAVELAHTRTHRACFVPITTLHYLL
ncbi:uncharacterized protein LOC144143849 [Haemaphysalis longicornis]